MEMYFLLLSFIFGTIIGSFLNVVAFRYNTGTTVGGRSRCLSCSRTLTWIELVPLFSFLAQKGACRKCKSKISWQYPLVEFLAGVLFVLIFFTFPPLTLFTGIITLIQLFIASILVVITVYDIKHKIIPDALVYVFAFVALASLFVGPNGFVMPLMINLLAGPLCALPFALLWIVSKGEWIGLGDAKLVLGIGWLLGFVHALSALALAFWIGAAVSIIWMLLTYRRLKARYEIPFGPYLILGMYLVLIFGFTVIDIQPFLSVFNIAS